MLKVFYDFVGCFSINVFLDLIQPEISDSQELQHHDSKGEDLNRKTTHLVND